MKISRQSLPVVALVLVSAALLFATLRWRFGGEKRAPREAMAASSEGAAPPVTTSGSASESPPANPIPADTASARLEHALEALTASKDATANRALLASLRQFLATLPPEVASREIQKFLAANRDAATQLDVTIQPGGALGDASSLRVFLLDQLGQLDRPAAGALAAQTLATCTTPDEWAVSLRNYAWAHPGPEAEAFLQAKSRTLLQNAAWLRAPSAGFLEAFDTIVYARGTTLAPDLAGLVRDKANRAAGHAAYLTLDRLTIAEPVAMLQQFVEQPDLMTGREQTRANYVARADVRAPEQRALVERYLLDSNRSAEELKTFAGLYPSANFMISNNLLTPTPTPNREQLIEHDRAALEVVRAWHSDPRFEKLRPHIESIQRRLEGFAGQ